MFNKETNYSKYSLDDLNCALRGLDKERFPERSALIKKLIIEQLKNIEIEREAKCGRACEFVNKGQNGQHILLTTSSESGSKTAIFFGNLVLTLFFIFIFINEPSWLLGGTIILMSLLVIGLFELASGQLKVSFDKDNLNITQLGLKIFRRNKTIPLSDIKVISLQTIRAYAKGFPVNTYILQAKQKNGFAQRLTIVKSEQEGLDVADQINAVISKIVTT